MSSPRSQMAKSDQHPKKKAVAKAGTSTAPKTSKAPAARPTGAEPLLEGAEDDRTLPRASAARRSPDSASDRARDERLITELEGNAAGSVADRHRQGLTATENEEDDLPQDLDDGSGEGLSEPTAPGAEDEDLSGAVVQERVERLDPDYRDGQRRRAGGRAAKDV